MKIKITKSTAIGGKIVKAGDVVDARDVDARYLMALGKAVAAPKAPKAPKKAPVNKSINSETLATK